MTNQIAPPLKAKGMVHKMIADTAKGCCEAQWETLAQQNKFYKANPDKATFVRRFWPNYIEIARAILTGMLGNPNYSEEKKALIHDALLRDGAVNPKKMAKPASPIIFPTSKT
jgi:hypothetical protein